MIIMKMTMMSTSIMDMAKEMIMTTKINTKTKKVNDLRIK